MGLFDLPNAHDKSATIGGRRDVKYVPVPQEFDVSGPLSADEGDTETFTFTTNQPDGTYYFANIPTGEVSADNGSFTVTGGTGTFSLTPNTDGVVGDIVLMAVTVRSGSITGPILAVTSVTITDDTFVQTYSASGPTTLAEGSTGTYNFFTNDTDGTYNFTVQPTGRFNVNSGTFTVTSEYGSFVLTGLTNTQRDDDQEIEIVIKNSGNTTLDTLSTTITDASPVTQPAVGFVEIVSKGDTWKYEDTDTDLGTEWRGVNYDDSSWSSGAGQLGFGGDGETTSITSGATTYYFRKTITIDDGDTYDEYDIDVTYDDGFVFYINGVAVADANINTASYNHSSLATATVTNNAQYTATISSSTFRDGVNVLACEVHQASVGSSDLGWDAGLSGRETADYTLAGPSTVNEGAAAITYTLTLKSGVSDGTFYLRPAQSGGFVETEKTITTSSGTGTTTFSAAPDTDFTEGDILYNLQLWSATGGTGTLLQSISTTVVDIDPSATGPAVGTYEQFAFGATWKYNDSGTDPGSFTSTSYDDSSWSSGAGELGFGDGDETTTISDVNQISNQFRKTINITDGDLYDEIDYDIKFDDGVVLYINGVEQARSSNWPSGTIAWNTLATGTISDNARLTGTIDASDLVDGDNVIAVQVSQNNTSSSDVSFNMGLSTVKLEDAPAGSVTYSFQDGDANGYAGTTDTYVQSGANTTTNRGSTQSMIVDKNASNERFSLLRFDDLDDAYATPADIVVTSAELQLTVNSEGQGTTFHNMLGTWADSITYATIGTLATGGTGYTLSATGTDPGADGYTGDITITLDSATVQDWIRTGVNYGLWGIATHSSDGTQYRSSEWTTQTQRPKLTIVSTGTDLA